MTRISAALFFIVVFFFCSSAIAATHEHHNTAHNATHHPISPFDKNKEGLSLHCALKGHPIDQVCPENLLNSTIQELIASDCGTHPLDAGSNINYSRSLLAVNMRFQSNLLFTGQLIIPHIYKPRPNIQSPLEHPPQHNI